MVSISINMTWFERRLRHHVLQCQVWWEAFLAQLVWDVSLYREKMVGKGNWSLANRLLHHVLGERAMFLQRAHCEIFMVHSSFFFPVELKQFAFYMLWYIISSIVNSLGFLQKMNRRKGWIAMHMLYAWLFSSVNIDICICSCMICCRSKVN